MTAIWKKTNKEVIVLMRDFRYGYASIKNIDGSGITMYTPLSELLINADTTI